MRVLYLARHGAGGNDEEGAVAHALAQLGHEVVCLPERRCETLPQVRADLLLCHHLPRPSVLGGWSGPKVCWCFDLISSAVDPTFNVGRRPQWARQMLEVCDLGFFTDGEFVRDYNAENLYSDPTVPGNRMNAIWLPQGADERLLADGPATGEGGYLLFTGSVRHSRRWAEWLAAVRGAYGERVRHVVCGSHGEALRRLVQRAAVVLCPDAPAADRYYSNRVFLSLGFGGFVLHPWCEGLGEQYAHGKGVVYYANRADMLNELGYYLGPFASSCRREIAAAGLETTRQQHTYRHRLVEMLRVVKVRLGVS